MSASIKFRATDSQENKRLTVIKLRGIIIMNIAK